MELLATSAGYGPAQRRSMAAMTVGGVGKQAQQCTQVVKHHICLDSGESGTFEAPEIPESDVPALLGMRALTTHRVLLDVFNRRMYRIGQGGYRLQLSPGSQMHELAMSNNGHLMLPCSSFECDKGSEALAFPASPENE